MLKAEFLFVGITPSHALQDLQTSIAARIPDALETALGSISIALRPESRRELTCPIEYHVYVEVYTLARTIGAYHSEICIEGGERPLRFMFCSGKRGTGVVPIVCTRRFSANNLKQRVDLGKTRMRPAELQAILGDLAREWPAASYSLLTRNCNHFARVACARLNVNPLPAWINQTAELLNGQSIGALLLGDVVSGGDHGDGEGDSANLHKWQGLAKDGSVCV